MIKDRLMRASVSQNANKVFCPHKIDEIDSQELPCNITQELSLCYLFYVIYFMQAYWPSSASKLYKQMIVPINLTTGFLRS